MEEQNKSKKEIILILGILLIFFSLIVILSLQEKKEESSYNFYSVDCTLTSFHDRCNQTIQVENITVKGNFATPQTINEDYLNSLCNKIDNQTWGCGKFLIKKNEEEK